VALVLFAALAAACEPKPGNPPKPKTTAAESAERIAAPDVAFQRRAGTAFAARSGPIQTPKE
jgi:hypothetical protein